MKFNTLAAFLLTFGMLPLHGAWWKTAATCFTVNKFADIFADENAKFDKKPGAQFSKDGALFTFGKAFADVEELDLQVDLQTSQTERIKVGFCELPFSGDRWIFCGIPFAYESGVVKSVDGSYSKIPVHKVYEYPTKTRPSMWGWAAIVGGVAALAYTASYVMKMFNKNK